MTWNRSLFRALILDSLLFLVALIVPLASGAGELSATWIDNANDENGFTIERRTAISETFTQIAIVGPDVTSYNDSGLVEGEIYCYRVFAFNAAGSSTYSNEACSPARPDASGGLLAAVLPSSRSVQVGVPATAFATIINRGSTIGTGCGVTLLSSIPVIGFFQTTNPFTNQLSGYPNAPVDIPPGSTQTFVIDLTPVQPFGPVDAQMSFSCANTPPAPIVTGLDTLLLSASATPVPDILALAATPTNDGTVNIPGIGGAGAFSVATVNLGASGSITVSADTGSAILPLNVFLCETDPTNGQCISALSANVTTQINANATPTFTVFAVASGNVPFAPAAARIFVRFKDSAAIIRGLTSVAVRTQ